MEYDEGTTRHTICGEFLECRDKSGNTIEVYKYGDDYIPAPHFRMGRIEDPRTHLPRLRNMTARDDDIILCAYMKAGTHWVWEITKMLTNGQAEYAPGPKEDTMMEFRSVDKLDSLTSPRILNTHLRLSNFPRQMVEKKCKLIFVVRNPKDIAVSMYNHMSAKGSSFGYRGTFDDFLSLFTSDIVPHNPWATYMTGWEKDFALNTDIPRHIMYYEDLKRNPEEEIKKLASFLCVTCTDDVIQDIAEKCSFQKLKIGKLCDPKNNPKSFMYRKGEVGDWKNWFTVAQNEEFDRFLEMATENSKFTYNYT